MKEKPAIS